MHTKLQQITADAMKTLMKETVKGAEGELSKGTEGYVIATEQIVEQ